MKVTCYRTVAYKNIDVIEVNSIVCMPSPDEITDEDRELADKHMLCMNCADGSVTIMPPSFLISIE